MRQILSHLRGRLARCGTCLLLAAVLLGFSGCGGTPAGTPYPEQDALALMQRTEQCVADLLYGKTTEEQSSTAFGAVYGNYAQSLWKLFADVGAFLPGGGFVTETDGWFYPTVFHEGYGVKAAVMDGERLTVTEGFATDDPLLAGFERVTIFTKDASGEWVFQSFGGTVCVYKNGLRWNYLPLAGQE